MYKTTKNSNTCLLISNFRVTSILSFTQSLEIFNYILSFNQFKIVNVLIFYDDSRASE